jgi:sugar phosphate isomerase/epimerase
MKKIPIGTLVKGSEDPAAAIGRLSSYGFECFSIMFWQSIEEVDLFEMVDEVLAVSERTDTAISSLAVYGNVLDDSECGRRTLQDLSSLIEMAPSFGAPVVGCFAGRVPGASVPDSLQRWKAVFSPLAERAEELGVRIAFENCRLGDTWKRGKWNIAINPDAWELLFDAIPSSSIGLEWEPCHQLEMCCDSVIQLAQWAPRVFHVHGKDSRIDHALLASRGLFGAESWHKSCFPGRGDFDWAKAFAILNAHGYEGTIDIEGWNDRDYCGGREIAGQVEALRYLKQVRGD